VIDGACGEEAQRQSNPSLLQKHHHSITTQAVPEKEKERESERVSGLPSFKAHAIREETHKVSPELWPPSQNPGFDCHKERFKKCHLRIESRV
jgi:hypothetical protein